MPFFKGRLTRSDGSLIIPRGKPHNCYYVSGWNKSYSHTTVAMLLTNRMGDIAAVVGRQPDEPAEGGKLCLPGGYVELGHTLAATAVKETLEETGWSIHSGSLKRFAILDGPMTVPGRSNEHNFNIVHVYSAQAGRKVQQHDHEVTGVQWITRHNMPPRKAFAFGHYDLIRMWQRHCKKAFKGLPIVPSEMSRRELFLPSDR